ncbi:MAG: agmatine deiminase family protein [Actinomycetota bacterium]
MQSSASQVKQTPWTPSRRMPAEWEPHQHTWMAFPPPNNTFGAEGSASLIAARQAWTNVATTISQYEPVTLIAGYGQGDIATTFVGSEVRVVELDVNDAWIRDSGPTFTLESDGTVAAVDWAFNGWGAQEWASWEHDAAIARSIADLAGVPVRSSTLTNEGGGFHVDGVGMVLLTETVQQDPKRNPGWTRSQIEAEIHAQLGTTKALWFPRGLTRDYGPFGTRGHVDMMVNFARPGVVLVHDQRDPAHPDYDVSQELMRTLHGATDAAGHPLDVIAVPAPTVLEVDGEVVDYNYVNHYVGNGFLVVGTFDDPKDDEALELLAQVYPGRRIEPADGRTILGFGGGVHCITQQQPAGERPVAIGEP